MPDPDFSIKAGDTVSRLQATLENSGGTAVDIQSATVLFKLAAISGGTLLMNGTATNLQVGAGTTDGSIGKVAYSWGTADTNNLGPGLFNAEWEVAFASGAVQTFPNSGYFTIAIGNDL